MLKIVEDWPSTGKKSREEGKKRDYLCWCCICGRDAGIKGKFHFLALKVLKLRPKTKVFLFSKSSNPVMNQFLQL